jgi:hypothetical protein
MNTIKTNADGLAAAASLPTPGPWCVSASSGGLIVVPQNMHLVGIIADCGEGYRHERAANARLCAAAPELLAALRAAHAALGLLLAERILADPDFRPSKHRTWPTVEASFAAIAKATGAQS